MRLTKVLVLVAIVALALPIANAADAKNKFSVFVGYAMPMSDTTITEDTGEGIIQDKIEADDAMGYGLAYEYRYSDLMSFGASLSYFNHDVKDTFTFDGTTEFDGTIGDVTWTPILFDLNFHLLKDRKIDFYVGPTVGYAMWDDVSLNADGQDAFGTDKIKIDDSFVYGVNLGLDVPFGEKWAFAAGLRYLLVSADPSEGGDSLDVNPLILTVGVGYKF